MNKENILTYVSPIIDDAFKDKTITAYKEEIQSEQYLERNLAMLKLANHVGKGGLQLS